MNDLDIFADFKARIENGGADLAAWHGIGQQIEADKDLKAHCMAMRFLYAPNPSKYYRMGRIVTLDEIVPEERKIRMSATVNNPQLYFLFVGMLRGVKRESLRHVLFYNVDNVEMQTRNYWPDDCGWQFYLDDGSMITPNAYWLNNIINPAVDNIKYLSKDYEFGIFYHPTSMPVINTPCVPIIGRHNYFHFLIDQLPLIIYSQMSPHTCKFPVLLKNITPTQKDMCEFFGIRMANIQCLDDLLPPAPTTVVKLKNAFLPAVVPIPERIQLMREIIGSDSLPNGKKNIFICRKSTPTCPTRLSNQEELRKRLESIGFISIYAEDYTLSQKKVLFRDARIIMGAHGAGLTNAIFAPRRALIIEMMNSVANANQDRWEYIRNICASSGQNCVRIVCQPDEFNSNITREQDFSIKCDPDRLVRLIDTLTDALNI